MIGVVGSLAIGAGTEFSTRGFLSGTSAAAMPDSCVPVREYIGGDMPTISGLPPVGDVGLVIGVSLVVRPAQREIASCHLAASPCEPALKAKSCFVNPYLKETT